MAGDTEMILILAGLAIGGFVLLRNPNILSSLTGGGAAAAPTPASGTSSSASATSSSTASTWQQDPSFQQPCQAIGQPCSTAGQQGTGSNIWCLCGSASSTTPTTSSPYGQYPAGSMYVNPVTGQLIPLSSSPLLTTTLAPIDGGVLVPGQGVPLNPGQFVLGQPLPKGCKMLSNGVIACEPTSTRRR